MNCSLQCIGRCANSQSADQSKPPLTVPAALSCIQFKTQPCHTSSAPALTNCVQDVSASEELFRSGAAILESTMGDLLANAAMDLLQQFLSPGPRDVTDNVSTGADETNFRLPVFSTLSGESFAWESVDSPSFCHAIECAYSEVVHWKQYLFLVPSGSVGKEFVEELSRLFLAYSERSALEGIVMKASTVLPLLLLQWPHSDSRVSDHVLALERRLHILKQGDIDSLVREGRALQSTLAESWHRRVNSQSSESNGRHIA